MSATNTAAMIKGATRITGVQSSRLVREVRLIEQPPTTATALRDGLIHIDQALVITTAVDALPDEVANKKAEAEAYLLAAAREHGAQALRILGKKLLEVIAPDQADELIAKQGQNPPPARPPLAHRGLLGTDHLISPGQARGLAATPGIIPVVLGGKSHVLDLGRKRRLFARAQRVAMAIRQGGLCNRHGCDPATWCGANHKQPWATGGRTDLAHGELICPHDHTLVTQGHDYPRGT